MPPRPAMYTKISFEMKQMLINSINSGETMLRSCTVLGIPIRSGQRIYKDYMNAGMLVPNLPRGGPRTKKLTDDQILEIQSWIDEDCTITLSEIKGRIL